MPRIATAHECLRNAEEDTSVLGNLSLLANIAKQNARQGVVGKYRERVVSLIGKNLSVGQNKIRGRRVASPPRFQRLLKSLYAI